ncbi:MAG: valine--tRNA ligase [Actinobacteria bacterium]|nr:valine--tRNA ligase [Actinomycetota bacterium]
MIKEITGKYKPQDFEKDIYNIWLEKKYFHGITGISKPPYCIVIPPPNVTGFLHMGHALNNILQDIVIRYKRMKGYNCAWIPGTDHAGIATQNVVERELEKQGTSRHELGRDKFQEKVWQWREKYGSRIISQLKILGCSCDWARERFTLDDGYVKAVNREFVTLYNDGLIYRGNYIVNWCPRCLTAVSDIEVEHQDKHGYMWDIKYPLIDEKTGNPSSDEYIVVSTTRPETMLGDTAVAVNPKDKRYKKFSGKMVFLPIAARKIPIIEDDYVDMKFGTGAVKVTPSHDPNDFEIAKRHNLAQINIMNEDASLNENAGKYAGFDRFEAREKILNELNEKGYLYGKKNHISSVGFCSRCSKIIEPRVSMQWFVSMKKLSIPAINAVKTGKIKFVPKKWEKIYFNWMENIKDWCISRQLWWGHRIPVWYCRDCDEIIVSEETPLKCSKCNSSNLIQDNDVLDTWFSSDMWPFASLGWPEDTPELHYFFPTNLLITAHDIIFFWVARMIMISLYFMKDIPFKEVFINPLVNDSKGQKMSKSKGNAIDPVELIDKYGCDVLRFTLTSLTTPGRNLLLGQEKIEGSGNFANKIWNASKFVISSLSGLEQEIKNTSLSDLELNIWDRWILEKLNITIKGFEKYIEKFNFAFASRLIYHFFWSEFCDWYIEISKKRIYGQDILQKKTAASILNYVLENYLKILHPVMPFLTEAVWQNIVHDGESIMIRDFPATQKKYLSVKESHDIKLLFEIISAIRKIRSEHKINPAGKIKIYLTGKTQKIDTIKLFEENEDYIKLLCKADKIYYGSPEAPESYIKTGTKDFEIFIYMIKTINIELEIKRIEEELKKLRLELGKSSAKISNPQFISKAPDEIIRKEKSKAEEFAGAIFSLEKELDAVKKLRK